MEPKNDFNFRKFACFDEVYAVAGGRYVYSSTGHNFNALHFNRTFSKVSRLMAVFSLSSSVADPDPHVFGPPGSGSTSQRYGSGSCYGSGSGSFYHHAKIVRKTLTPAIL
jgi:hypothetical protein